MDIARIAYKQIKEGIQPGRVLILYGPRRTGKTFLLTKLIADDTLKLRYKIAMFNGDESSVQHNLSLKNSQQMRNFVGKDTSLLIIDEAQHIPFIGDNIKLLIDTYPELTIILSGSASFELAQKVGEPLTGRQKTLYLYPLSAQEIIESQGRLFYEQTMEEGLIYGGYPKLFSLPSMQDKKEYLTELVDSYLFRDILELEQVRNSRKLRDLLTLIAHQIGMEVSLQELGTSIGIHKDTVARYLDLFEKSFVLINVRGFSRNLRKEITKTSRYYFYDNGIRNTLIQNFNPLSLRNDVGQLWENYIVIERRKKRVYEGIHANTYFWRTYDQKEIDSIEEREGKLFGYEIKWGKNSKKAPKEWVTTYPGAEYHVITCDNHLDFIS